MTVRSQQYSVHAWSFSYSCCCFDFLRASGGILASPRCTNLDLTLRFLTMCQRGDVSTARISSTLMCSALPCQCHPIIVFQDHSDADRLTRNLWYLRISSVGGLNHDILTFQIHHITIRSLATKSYSPFSPSLFLLLRLCRCRKPPNILPLPGLVTSTASWGFFLGHRPKTKLNGERSQTTTVKFRRLPIKLFLMFS